MAQIGFGTVALLHFKTHQPSQKLSNQTD